MVEDARKQEASSTGDADECRVGSVQLDAETCNFYRDAMHVLERSGISFLVGGAYALERYTGIARHTKDFDIFVRRADAHSVLDAFEEAGYRSEMTFPHWLGKVYGDDSDLFIDIIFSSGNGVAEVDDEWFERAPEGKVLGMPARLCPPEEIIWPKCFVQERERFDGADVAHLFRACAAEIDWDHLLARFGDKWRVLFGQLVLFGFIYPAERDIIPASVMNELINRLQDELRAAPPLEHVVQGTLISRQQYMIDIHEWGYEDARLKPRGNMSQAEIDHWTASIEKDGQ